MDDNRIVLVYERISTGTYLYALTGIIVPTGLYSKELPASTQIEAEALYLDPIFNEEEREFLQKLKTDPEFIPLNC